MDTPKFNALQMRQYAAYEKVRSGGRFNMYDPRAQRAAGLNTDDYLFVINNFRELRKQAEEEAGEE